MMKKGLVMEGGAMRGMFTAGVIDVMMEHQITFDGAMACQQGQCLAVIISPISRDASFVTMQRTVINRSMRDCAHF